MIIPFSIVENPKEIPIQVTFDWNDFPDIVDIGDDENPALSSPNAIEDLYFYQTKESLADVERYSTFIKSSISRFRRSRTYKNYKGYLMSLGLNRCQKMGNISEEMATIEMHHNILTIFDIAVLITEHVLNTTGKISSFDLVYLLKQEHKNNNIPIVMLSLTAHEMYHNDSDNFIPINMTFGKWWELLYKYRYGITIDIAYKINEYINRSLHDDTENNGFMLQLRDHLFSYANYNEYGYDPNRCGYINTQGSYIQGGNNQWQQQSQYALPYVS